MNKLEESQAFKNYTSLHSEPKSHKLLIGILILTLVACFSYCIYASFATIDKAVDHERLMS